MYGNIWASLSKAELLRQQEEEIKELRRKHEEAQRAFIEESIDDIETEHGKNETDLLKALREVDHNQYGAQRSCPMLADT